MTEHGADAVVERVSAVVHSRTYSKTLWGDLNEYERDHDRKATRAVLAALKPGDRLPGVDEHGQPITLVVVPEKPTWAMEQASITAPMPPHSNRATKKKRHENLVAKIHSRWSAMLAASTTTEPRGQNDTR